MTLLVPTLKTKKKHIPSIDWKSLLALVGNSYIHKLGIGPWSGIGGSNLTIKFNLA